MAAETGAIERAGEAPLERAGDPALAALAARGLDATIDVALVLGSGLGDFTKHAREAVAVPYSELPGFPKSGVSGHAGRLVLGRVEGRRVGLLEGRAHYYEHGDPRAMLAPLCVARGLGARALLLTNAAGSLREDWPPGSVVALADHINFSGPNPLVGDHGDARFTPMTGAYDADLRMRLRAAAAASGGAIGEGVYMWFSGPSFETPAEVRMARMLGADLVGMSTVPETILARRLGLRVAALSLVTNYGAGFGGGDPSHEETRLVARAGADRLAGLLAAFLRDFP